VLTDGSGNVTATYAYDVFGALRASTGTGSTEYRFTGQQADAPTGFQYLRARYYDPSTGRFLSKDPFRGLLEKPGSQHRYAYTRNDPVNWVDPTDLRDYTFNWYIGKAATVGSPQSVMAYFQQHPRAIFPFDLGQCDTIQLGARCDLLGAAPFTGVDPVEVTYLDSTSFEFTPWKAISTRPVLPSRLRYTRTVATSISNSTPTVPV
jgi:RHS repeat-associated protein